MAVSNAETIMSAIDRRARRVVDAATLAAIEREVLVDEAIDETGTIEGIPSAVEERFLQQQFTRQELEEVRRIDDDLLKVHGKAPMAKKEGAIRLLYENTDGLNPRMSGNEKVERGREMFDELEVDIVALNETKINVKHNQNVNGLAQLFNGGEAEVKVVHGCNYHDGAISKIQQGGTAVLTFGPLIEQFDHMNSGTDATGLGRFSFSRYIGDNGIATWVVCGYQPCVSKGPSTSYQQQRRYFIAKGRPDTKPRDKFFEDLIALLKSWREEGDRIIVCLDANENIYTKRIGQALTDIDGLAMKEVVGEYTGTQLGATHFRGSQPIDGIWATQDIEILNACVMPVGYGMGDHRCFVIDISQSSMVGRSPVRVKRLQARRLNNKLPGVQERYTKTLEQLLLRHKVDEDHRKAHLARTKEEAQELLATSERKSQQFMAHAEKRCRKIKSGRIPFSDEAVKWIKRAEAYRTLLRYKAGKKVNRGNLGRKCRRLLILRPFQLPVVEIAARLKACENKCDHFRKHGQRYRRKHLDRRLGIAQKKGDEVAEKRILAIIKGERDRAFWRKLNYNLGKRLGGSIRAVQVEDGRGGVIEYDTKDAVEKAILQNIHGKGKRFYQAEDAPICRGRLRGQFGYNANTAAARSVLDGTYDFSEDYHEATQQLFEQIAKIRALVPMNSVETLIDGVTWASSWRRSKEATSSSISGLHFGHYIAGAESDYISNYHAVKTSIALMRGISLSRWQRGLACMLEKKAGSRLVTKLRSILLLEADLNKANKIIYGDRMMNNIRKYQLMPEDIFSERNRTAEDGALTKLLFFDIGRQLRTPSAIASIDASNCYDRIAHAIASLVFQAFGVAQSATESMLTTIQEMKYFLRTAYGDSSRCEHSTVEVKYQGLCQGNGAAPAGWAAISVTILMAHKANGHGATFVCPLSPKKSIDLAAILFVDDTDIIHINMKKRESIWEVHEALAASVRSWNELLMATGGTLHPDKCFYYLMSYTFDKRKLCWQYEDHSEDPEFDIELTLPDGTPFLMKHHSVHHPETMLGVATCPSGSCRSTCSCPAECKGALDILKEKASDSAQRVLGSPVNRRQFWKWLTACFWPKVSFGLSCNTASIKELQDSLQKTYFDLMPKGGLIRTAPKALRDLDIGFYGAGFPNVPIECGIQQLNKLLMHFGCSSSAGTLLQTSVELFIVELGRSHQPFEESFKQYHSLVTTCWARSVWEKVDYYGVKVVLNNIEFPFPRVGDKWIMRVFEELQYDREQLRRLNRVRLHQQVLFLSDVLCAKGSKLDPQYKRLRHGDETWSNLDHLFPAEEPSAKDFALWKQALTLLAPGGFLRQHLGNWLHAGHKLRPWRFCSESNRLLRLHGNDLMDVYPRAIIPPFDQNPNRYAKSGRAIPRTQNDVACTVEEIAPGVYRVVNSAPLPGRSLSPSTLWEVLEHWGSTWMWDDLEMSGDFEFLAVAIADGSLVCVADGSFIKEMYPDICSAAFIMECSKGRGRLIGKFSERTLAACAYRGELLGLLAIHLLLLAVNKLSPSLSGFAQIYSDCLGALHNVENLPPHRIPSSCRHSDILKTIMIHCRALTFRTVFSHVSAHKLDYFKWDELTRPEQLNEQCDSGAKLAIYNVDPDEALVAQPFPLEPICVYVNQGKEKMTSDTGARIRFHCHYALAKEIFARHDILSPAAFAQVDWPNVNIALHGVPRCFQLWACKQVHNIAGTNQRLHRQGQRSSPLCPSCLEVSETCAHVLMCDEENRVQCFQMSANNLESWLKSVGTCDLLEKYIMTFVRARNSKSFKECIGGTRDPLSLKLARSQDKIGWRRFMEGMISKEFCRIQETQRRLGRTHVSGAKWAQSLSVKLLEMTHGQWLVRNFLIHDKVAGMLALEKKEDLQIAIEEQQAMGLEGLAEEDKYLMEISLADLETTSGEYQAYWLIAVKAARNAFLVRRQRAQAASRRSQTNHG